MPNQIGVGLFLLGGEVELARRARPGNGSKAEWQELPGDFFLL